MDNNVMWAVWWTITVMICAWKLIEGFLRPRRMLEWPFLACAMWAYFYGYMAYNAKVGLPEYLGNGIANIGQFMPLLCLVAILAGWHLGTHGRQQVERDTRTYPYLKIYLAGLVFLAIGAAGAYSVMRHLKAGDMNYAESSGYWYLLFYVGYPGLAMNIWALFRMSPAARKYLWLVTLVVLAGFMYPHLQDARRGPLFPAVMVLLLVPPLATRRAPNPLLFFGVLVVAAIVMLAFLQVREVIYAGGSWQQALHRVDVGTAVTDKTERAEDNEYINNCQLMGTLYQNGKYEYGSGHLSLLWHWVPRAIWKDKPGLGEGIYSTTEVFDDVEAATGYRLLGTGAASGGVAETFMQYGPLCPLFWFALSWGMGLVYFRALVGNNPRWLFCYIGCICATHWLVSQGFSAAFVPCMFFQIVPVAVFGFLGAFSPQPVAAMRSVRAWPGTPGTVRP